MQARISCTTQVWVTVRGHTISMAMGSPSSRRSRRSARCGPLRLRSSLSTQARSLAWELSRYGPSPRWRVV
jgi:hypothetical protein